MNWVKDVCNQFHLRLTITICCKIMQMYGVSSLQCSPPNFNLSLSDVAACIWQLHFSCQANIFYLF